MPRIRVYDEDWTLASGPTASPASADAFGQVGRAVEDFSSHLAVVAEAERRRQTHQGASDLVAFEQAERAALDEARTRAAPDAADFTRTAMAAFGRRADALEARLPEPLRPDIDALRASLARESAAFETTRRWEHYERSVSLGEDQLAASIGREPERLDRAQALGLTLIAQSGIEDSLKADRAAAWRTRAQSEALKAKFVAAGLAGEREESVSALLSEGRFADVPQEAHADLWPIYAAARSDREHRALADQANGARTAFRQSAETLRDLVGRIETGRAGATELLAAQSRLLPFHAEEAQAALSRERERLAEQAALWSDVNRAPMRLPFDPNQRGELDRGPFDPDDPNRRGRLQRLFDQDGGAARLKARDEDYVATEFLPLIRRTGVVPDGAVQSLTGLTRSDDPGTAAWAFGVLDRLKRQDGPLFLATFGEAAAGAVDRFNDKLTHVSAEDAASGPDVLIPPRTVDGEPLVDALKGAGRALGLGGAGAVFGDLFFQQNSPDEEHALGADVRIVRRPGERVGVVQQRQGEGWRPLFEVWPVEDPATGRSGFVVDPAALERAYDGALPDEVRSKFTALPPGVQGVTGEWIPIAPAIPPLPPSVAMPPPTPPANVTPDQSGEGEQFARPSANPGLSEEERALGQTPSLVPPQTEVPDAWEVREPVPGTSDLNIDSTTLGRALKLTPHDGMRAHHLIGGEVIAKKSAFFKQMAQWGWRPNVADNGIALPGSDPLRQQMIQSGQPALPVHSGRHPYQNANRQLEVLQSIIDKFEDNELSQEEALKLMKQAQETLRNDITTSNATRINEVYPR